MVANEVLKPLALCVVGKGLKARFFIFSAKQAHYEITQPYQSL